MNVSISPASAPQRSRISPKPPLIGLCGWAGSQPLYYTQFPTIEIQSTFYDPPANKVAERWRAAAPPDFIFCIKAWQLITHAATSPTYRRLRQPLGPESSKRVGAFQNTDEVWAAWEKSRQIAEILRAAVVLFQCPASFTPTPDNIRNLQHFFERIGPQPFQLAWEPRGAWPCDVIRDLCTEYNLIHCVDPLSDHLTPSRSIHNRVYWRLHGKGSYAYRYTAADLLDLRTQWLAQNPSEPAYILFNNVSMKEDALRFAEMLRGTVTLGTQ